MDPAGGGQQLWEVGNLLELTGLEGEYRGQSENNTARRGKEPSVEEGFSNEAAGPSNQSDTPPLRVVEVLVSRERINHTKLNWFSLMYHHHHHLTILGYCFMLFRCSRPAMVMHA